MKYHSKLTLIAQQVKVWCTKQEASVISIDMKANICSVKYNPQSSFHIAVSHTSSWFNASNYAKSRTLLNFYTKAWSCFLQVGSADNHIHYYDLRNIKQPLHIFSGHHKTVSYVKFVSNNVLASASTDGTLRLWDVKENVPVSNHALVIFSIWIQKLITFCSHYDIAIRTIGMN